MPRLSREEAWQRFVAARVARLATVTPEAQPHLVPVVFAVVDGRIYSAVDDKPKATTQLRRLSNIRANPQVSLLADHYDDDWSQLWWVRVDGRARVLEGGAEADSARVALASRYEQYAGRPPAGPVVAVSVNEVRGWQSL